MAKVSIRVEVSEEIFDRLKSLSHENNRTPKKEIEKIIASTVRDQSIDWLSF